MRMIDLSADGCSSDLLSLGFNDFRSPEALDPLGLTRAQFDEKPKQAAPQAEQYNTRKRTKQTQGGVPWSHQFTEAQSTELLASYGSRGFVQYFSIPPEPKAIPTHSGGCATPGTAYASSQPPRPPRGGDPNRPRC